MRQKENLQVIFNNVGGVNSPNWDLPEAHVLQTEYLQGGQTSICGKEADLL
jgi:hypothetical protein